MALPFVDQSPDQITAGADAPRATSADRAAEPAPPAWFALRCSVPDGALRASVWRALKKMGALNVQRSVWIVRDDPEQRARADVLRTRVDPTQGTIEIVAEMPASEERAVLSRLQRACERQWDDLVDRLDDYDAEVAAGTMTLEDRLETLADLTADHGRHVELDIVGSATGAQVVDRLRAAALELVAQVEADGFDDASWRRTRSGVRRHVRLLTSWPLTDGRRSFVATLHPHADPLWELALERFEARTYLADDRRVPLRAGVFRWVGEPGDDDDALDALSRRVGNFEATLG